MRVTRFECFEMQMVINVAPVSLSIKKVNFYTCPRLTFLKKNATENAYKSISEPLDFKIFWGACPQIPQRLAPSALETCLVSFSSLATALLLWLCFSVYLYECSEAMNWEPMLCILYFYSLRTLCSLLSFVFCSTCYVNFVYFVYLVIVVLSM